MNIAIPTWDSRVSPVLDTASCLLVVSVDSGKEIKRRVVGIPAHQLAPRAREIASVGVEVLICGALSWPLEALLVAAGIKVMPHICGPVEDVLRAFLSGRLTDGVFLMPGCCGRRRRFRGSRRPDGRHGVGP